mmetsp:Transcript_42013/g.75709  ORF Transcript_42013/g.75709 Transcript_42013/m.75709 type:complete len:549 (+) Transcript_42013:243-1889(+)
MGNVAAVPIIGEIVTVAESAGKTVAAGACAVVGESGSAKKLIKGAGKSWENYVEVNAVAANINMAAAAIDGDDKKVKKLKERQRDAWSEIGENTPVVGHVAGVVNYAVGNSEAGDRCMIGATRSAAVAAAAVASGGTAAFATAAAYDGVATGLNSAAKGKYAPTGNVAGVDNAIRTKDVNNYFDAIGGVVMDGVGTKGGAKITKTIKAKRAKKTTPARKLAEQHNERPSVMDRYTPHDVVPNSSKQATLSKLQQHPGTKNMIKSFNSPVEAVRSLTESTKYDFVRLTDGSIRYISHADRAAAFRILGENNPVGHTSLIPPGQKVIAAGEILVNAKGVIYNINPQSGHFRVPLTRFVKQKGKAFPTEVVTFESQVFKTLFAENPQLTLARDVVRTVGNRAVVITAYGMILCGPDSNGFDEGSHFTHIIAWHENDRVNALAYGKKAHASEAFKVAGTNYAKVMFSISSGEVEESYGCDMYVNQCVNFCTEFQNDVQGTDWDPNVTDWDPNVMCDGHLARDRAVWLVENKHMRGYDAMLQVMDKYTSQFCD